MKFLLAVLALCIASSSAWAAQYESGDTWRRWSDWVPGQAAGSSQGNAAPDLRGTPVWRYGVLTGGNLASDDPWYLREAQLMVWDDEWWGSNGAGVWARDYFGPGADNDNANPPVSQYTIFHDVSARTHSQGFTAAVDWLNPVGDGAIVNVSGTLNFKWEGAAGAVVSPLAPAEAVIAKYDAGQASFETLWSGRVENPNAGLPFGTDAVVGVPLTFAGLRFDEGDYLRFTLRLDMPETDPSLWLGMGDSFVFRLVSVVPEVSTFQSLGSGLVLLWLILARSPRRNRLRAIRPRPDF